MERLIKKKINEYAGTNQIQAPSPAPLPSTRSRCIFFIRNEKPNLRSEEENYDLEIPFSFSLGQLRGFFSRLEKQSGTRLEKKFEKQFTIYFDTKNHDLFRESVVVFLDSSGFRRMKILERGKGASSGLSCGISSSSCFLDNSMLGYASSSGSSFVVQDLIFSTKLSVEVCEGARVEFESCDYSSIGILYSNLGSLRIARYRPALHDPILLALAAEFRPLPFLLHSKEMVYFRRKIPPKLDSKLSARWRLRFPRPQGSKENDAEDLYYNSNLIYDYFTELNSSSSSTQQPPKWIESPLYLFLKKYSSSSDPDMSLNETFENYQLISKEMIRLEIEEKRARNK